MKKKLRLRGVCDLCRSLTRVTPECEHKTWYTFPADMLWSELPEDLTLELNPKRRRS